MKAVMAFAGKARTAFAGQAASGGKEPFSGKQLGGMSRGMSAVGSLSEWAAARQEAKSLKTQAWDETMQGRQEYIQAAEQVNAIDAEYNRLVGSQLVTAAAMGIDVGSGSVVAAREAAQSDADRERRIIRNNAETNARMRFARSASLREAAKAAKFGANLKLAMNVFGG